MLPLPVAVPGEENIIKKIGGSPDVKKHLEDLGFTVGSAKDLKRFLKEKNKQ